MAEQLRGNQVTGDCRTVHANEGSPGSLRRFVDCACDEFLAGTRLPCYQDCGVSGSDFGDARKNNFQPIRGADNFIEHRGALDLVPESYVFPIELVLEKLEIVLGALTVDALCDAISNEGQGLQRALGKRLPGEHSHDPYDPVLDHERVTGKGLHFFGPGPVVITDSRIVFDIIGQMRFSFSGNQADLKLANWDSTESTIQTGVHPCACFQL